VRATKIQEPEQRETYLIIADYLSLMPAVCSHRASSSDPKLMFRLLFLELWLINLSSYLNES